MHFKIFPELFDNNFIFGGFLEDRSQLADYNKFHKVMIHLGIDLYVPINTVVSVPSSCTIYHIYNDQSKENGWGMRIIFKLDNKYNNCSYLLYGHLKYNDKIFIGQQFIEKEIVGEIADVSNNGGWTPHLHVQCMTDNFMKFYTDDFDGIRDKLIVDLFYTTGIRRTELINLKLNNIDLSNGTLKVLGKRNKERIIPILPVVENQIKLYLTERSHLQRIVDGEYFFLLLKGVKLNDSFVYRLINYYFSNVSEKVKKSPHILRHTFATHLLNNGADINSVKELLGHSSLASTQVYTHSSLAELKKVYGNAHPRNKQ